MVISNLRFFFQKFLAQIPKFGPKSIDFLNLSKILLVRCFEGADFKSDIGFREV